MLAEESGPGDGGATSAVRVHHEPFGHPFYYHAAERGSLRFAPESGTPSFGDVQAAIEAPVAGAAEHVFVKDMAYYMRGRLSQPIFAGEDALTTHAFLIRHPAKTVPSLHRGCCSAPDYGPFDPKESGFVELLEVFKHVTGTLGQQAVVVDADDLLDAPKEVLQAFCARVGLPWREACLSWTPGVVPPGWEAWPGWHDDAINSDGLRPRVPAASDGTSPAKRGKYESELALPEVAAAVAEAVPIYEELRRHCAPGVPHGHGTEVTESGDTYVGFSFHAKKHGKGKLSRADGSSYEGDWANGIPDGLGI